LNWDNRILEDNKTIEKRTSIKNGGLAQALENKTVADN